MKFEKYKKNGVVFLDEGTTFIDDSVQIDSGTIVEPMVVLQGNTIIGKDCFVGSGSKLIDVVMQDYSRVVSSHIEKSIIGEKAEVGPNAHIRPKCIVGKNCRVGNFVELKACVLGEGTKVAHLTYVGDAEIGKHCNIGCGVIFVNYDGKAKHKTIVGDNCFVGSNCNIIAPVKISDNAYVAAGTTVTKDIKGNEFCIGRVKQETKANQRNKYVENLLDKSIYDAPKLFGTDGVRGIYGEKINETLVDKIGQTLALEKPNATIVVGRDTRQSGQSLLNALAQGVISASGKVLDLGVTTTPSVSFMTKEKGADYGVVVTASHNPPDYNGIKLFDKNGCKISDELEKQIERRVASLGISKKGQIEMGKLDISPYVKQLIQVGENLRGLKVVLDAGNGASGEIAEFVFTALGAKVILLNKFEGDCSQINNNQGALFPEVAKKSVLDNKADMGFSFDGDADRIIAIGSNGEIIDGDAIMLGIAKNYVKNGILEPKIVVATKQSNLALSRELQKIGVATSFVAIGDKYVAREMKELGAMLGGEQSGHIIHGHISPSGDGVLTAVVLAKMCREENQKLEHLCEFSPNAQMQKSYPVENKEAVLKNEELVALLDKTNNALFPNGRAYMRASGTEPKIRLLVEAENKKDCEQYFLDIDAVVTKLCQREKI